jgi:hypothetical protein
MCKNCTKATQLSPNTMISPTQQHFILLKTLHTQTDFRTTNQKVGSSTLSGRATSSPASSTSYAATDFTSPS